MMLSNEHIPRVQASSEYLTNCLARGDCIYGEPELEPSKETTHVLKASIRALVAMPTQGQTTLTACNGH